MSFPSPWLRCFEWFLFPAAQFTTQKFAGRGAGNGFDKDILFRPLETSKLAAQAYLIELFGPELSDGRLDEGHAFGAEPLVRHADNGTSGDQLAADKRVLHFLRMDIFPATDNHVV